ncbi:hypothetical protein K449DRAFT_456851 [Hypoxylon sp. EC38]|nr:hypothetical protein K449DRAFT_456851 [Hypoxylon sp. EC38]
MDGTVKVFHRIEAFDLDSDSRQVFNRCPERVLFPRRRCSTAFTETKIREESQDGNTIFLSSKTTLTTAPFHSCHFGQFSNLQLSTFGWHAKILSNCDYNLIFISINNLLYTLRHPFSPHTSRVLARGLCQNKLGKQLGYVGRITEASSQKKIDYHSTNSTQATCQIYEVSKQQMSKRRFDSSSPAMSGPKHDEPVPLEPAKRLCFSLYTRNSEGMLSDSQLAFSPFRLSGYSSHTLSVSSWLIADPTTS